jgi:hypothetical protein
MNASGTTVWRPKLWGRIAAVTFLIGNLWSMLYPQALNPSWTDGVPPDELPPALGFILLALALVWCVARSRIEVSADEVLVVNPWGTTKLRKTDVIEVRPGPFGVEFHTERRRTIGLAVQATALYVGDRPRWVEIAELVTGRTPEWQDSDPDDE